MGLVELAWAGLIWAELGWAGLRWAGLACAGLGWPGRKGRHVPRRARGAGATSQMYGAARALRRIAADHPGLPQTILQCRKLQWVIVNKGLSLFKGHRLACVRNRVGGRSQ